MRARLSIALTKDMLTCLHGKRIRRTVVPAVPEGTSLELVQ